MTAVTTNVVALVYAGGRGTRLGGAVKANIEIGGVRLLERVSAALGPDFQSVLVAHGAVEPGTLNLLPGQIAVPDHRSSIGGPLAGLAGAVAWCETTTMPPALILTVAVDTPFVPGDYAARMRNALGDGDAVVAAFDGQPYPTNSLWRLSALRGLIDGLRSGTAPGSLSRLAGDLRATHLDWPDDGDGDPFANVNTPIDLAALEARAARR